MSLEWNSECAMEGESGEQVGGELDSVTSSAGCFKEERGTSSNRVFELSRCREVER